MNIPKHECKGCASRDEIIQVLAEDLDKKNKKIRQYEDQLILVDEISIDDTEELAA